MKRVVMKSSSLQLQLCAAALVVALVMAGQLAQVSRAVTCSAIQLSPCAGAILQGQAPSGACCSKLKEQRPCLCGYLKDPNLKQYVNSPNAKRVAGICGVPTPSC